MLSCKGNAKIPNSSASGVFVVGYPSLTALKAEEQSFISENALTDGFPDVLKVQHTWNSTGDSGSTVRGTILTWDDTGTTMWLWTDWETHTLYWVQTTATPAKVFDWWKAP